MAESIKSRRANKPAKPSKDFPLFDHQNGQWAKKVRGKLRYFVPWDDPDAALQRWLDEKDYLLACRTPRAKSDGITAKELVGGCTIQALVNRFLTSKGRKLESGGLSRSSFADYHRVCGVLVGHFGKDCLVDDLCPSDFELFRCQLEKRLGVVTLRNEINRVRIIFKFAHDDQLIDRTVHYGQGFDKPAVKELRRARNLAGPRMFEAVELGRILDAADPIMRAMVLLGINCGFGNTDVASLPQLAINFETGWVNFSRVKTKICRRIPLWPETIESLREAIAQRPKPKDRADSDLCFVTVQGNRWVRIAQKQVDDDNTDDESKVRYVKRDTITSRFSQLSGIRSRRKWMRPNWLTIQSGHVSVIGK